MEECSSIYLAQPRLPARLRRMLPAWARRGKKPLCDNSHKRTNFKDKDILGDDRFIKEPTSDGRGLRIIPTVNRPFLLRGEDESRSAHGKTVYRSSRIAL
jgi:hypothetical protein